MLFSCLYIRFEYIIYSCFRSHCILIQSIYTIIYKQLGFTFQVALVCFLAFQDLAHTLGLHTQYILQNNLAIRGGGNHQSGGLTKAKPYIATHTPLFRYHCRFRDSDDAARYRSGERRSRQHSVSNCRAEDWDRSAGHPGPARTGALGALVPRTEALGALVLRTDNFQTASRQCFRVQNNSFRCSFQDSGARAPVPNIFSPILTLGTHLHSYFILVFTAVHCLISILQSCYQFILAFWDQGLNLYYLILQFQQGNRNPNRYLVALSFTKRSSQLCDISRLFHIL